MLVARIAERPGGDPGSNPFADEEGPNNAGNEREVVDNVADEGNRINQEAGGNEEDRDKQRLAEELQLDAGRLVMRGGIDRKAREERPDDARQLDGIGEYARHDHEAEHDDEEGVLFVFDPAQHIGP